MKKKVKSFVIIVIAIFLPFGLIALSIYYFSRNRSSLTSKADFSAGKTLRDKIRDLAKYLKNPD